LTKDEAPGEEEVFSLLQGGLERNRVWRQVSWK
jgi:hypothetical protein